MTNLAVLLDEAARRYPDRIAVSHGEVAWSYTELLAESGRVAEYLVETGVRRGDTVALSCPNVPSFTAAYFGILKAGGVVVPLSILLRPREIAYHVCDSGARWHIAHRGSDRLRIADTVREADVDGVQVIEIDADGSAPWSSRTGDIATVAVDPDDLAVIIYTSGTSGQPKGAELRHRNLRDNAMICASVYGVTGEPAETHLAVLPLFHVFGQSCMQNAAIAFGGRIALLERFDPVDVLRRIVEDRVTIFGGVPTMYAAILDSLDEARAEGIAVDSIPATLRVAASGGSAMAAQLHQRFREAFGFRVLDGYGLSEASAAVASARVGGPTRLGSVGRSLPGIEMSLIDGEGGVLPAPHAGELSAVGEVVIRGHGVMRGYHNRPEETATAIRDGWLRTGDLGRCDADGFFYIVDRLKDMIIRGGLNVYPRELEDGLMTHPDVLLAAVVGVPHDTLGEEVKAVVVRRLGSSLSEQELRAWGVEQFAAYKYPRIVEFRDQLPMTASGKILKRSIC